MRLAIKNMVKYSITNTRKSFSSTLTFGKRYFFFSTFYKMIEKVFAILRILNKQKNIIDFLGVIRLGVWFENNLQVQLFLIFKYIDLKVLIREKKSKYLQYFFL